MESPLRINQRPKLRNPYLIIGWADAGLVGVTAADYLVEKLPAEELGGIEPHHFYLLPQGLIKGGVLQEIEYPKNSFYYWENKKSANDLIILGSKPPAINHYELANLILDVAELFDVSRIYTVGGLHANIAHTDQPRLFAITNNPGLKKHLTEHDVESGLDHHGPISMNGLILGVAKRRNIEGISLWGQVPSYLGEMPNPRVCEVILKVLTAMLGVDIDFSGIEAEARYANKQIDKLVSYLRQQDPDLDRYIERLEKNIRLGSSREDRQRFFEEINEFLRKQKDHQEND